MKLLPSTLLLLCLATVASATYDAPSRSEVNTMIRVLKSYFRTDSVTFNHVPTAVRLAFHDCVGYACDGCINLNNPSNNGLSAYITWVEAIYTGEGYDAIVSRADFWQVAAIAATEMAIIQNNNNITAGASNSLDASYTMPTDIMTFRWGRTDCATSPTTIDEHEFPEPTMKRAKMMSYFGEHYDFSEDEVTALMGAHTLGGCDAVDSGYRGMWVLNEAIYLNTKYYQFILGGEDGATTPADIVNEPIDDFDSDGNGDKRFQWDLFNKGEYFDGSNERIGIMLNTDIELAYDIDPDMFDGTSCVLGDAIAGTACGKSDTYNTVVKYANDGSLWWTDYRAVFDKLTQFGYWDANGDSTLVEVARE